MALFRYQALDSVGKKQSGLIEAGDEKEAKEKLRDQGMMVSSLTTKVAGSSRENLRGDNLLAFTVQLSQLVNAGIPLYQSLVAIEEQYRNEPYHRIILSLCDQIKAGQSLSAAMSVYPQSFDKLYIAMISAGEHAGALNVVLDKLSYLLTRQNKLKKQITTALIYPAVLVVFCLMVISLLLGFVIPSMQGIFENRRLNGFTEAVLGVSQFLRAYWWIYVPLVAGLVALIVYWARSPKGRLWMERNFLKVPLIRTLIIQTAVSRFCRTMGTLLQGGLPIIESLRNARQVMRNVVLEQEILLAENRIVEGSSLSAELMNSKYVPRMVSRMLAVGEESGTTVTMFNKIADIYEENIEKTLDRLMALAQPIILIVMGSIIGVVLLAVLLPLTDISSFSMD